MSTDTEHDERVAKLPRWAQDRMRVLEMRLREQTERAETAEAAMNADATPAEDVDTFAASYAERPIPLGRGTRVQFFLDRVDPSSYIEVRLVRDRPDDAYIEVRSGHGQMAVYPRGSNSCEVRALRPRDFRVGR